MMAESSGRHDVVNYNPSTGDHSIGCFQVNILGNLAKERPSEEELKNPQVNVAYAHHLYEKHGFYPWSAYKNGSYLAYQVVD